MRSSSQTPTYFNLVIIDSLEKAFMHISLQFLSHDISSDIQTPNNFVTEILSNFESLTFSLVANFSFVLENITFFH